MCLEGKKIFSGSVLTCRFFYYHRPWHDLYRESNASLVKTITAYHILSLEQRIIRLKEKYPAWEVRRFDHRYNNWRKQEILNRMTPASVCYEKNNFNKD